MSKHVIGAVADIPVGQRKIVTIDGVSIGVFNVNGVFHALRNSCPHQGAPLCLGPVKGTARASLPGEYSWEREGEIIRCPWHGWEFDILTGRTIINPHRIRVKSYEVTVEKAITETAGSLVDDDEDPTVDSYEVTVEREKIVLHL